MLLPAQVGVALVVILVWHLFTATTIFGNPANARFFFSTPVDVAVRIYEWFAAGTIWYHLGITLLEAALAFIGWAEGTLAGHPVRITPHERKKGAGGKAAGEVAWTLKRID